MANLDLESRDYEDGLVVRKSKANDFKTRPAGIKVEVKKSMETGHGTSAMSKTCSTACPKDVVVIQPKAK